MTERTQRGDISVWVGIFLSALGLLGVGIGAWVSLSGRVSTIETTMQITEVSQLPKEMADIRASQRQGAVWREEKDKRDAAMNDKIDRLLRRVGDD